LIRQPLRAWLTALSIVCLLAGCASSGSPGEDEMGPKYQGPLPAIAVVPPQSSNPACRQGDPLAKVYHPQRLQVIQRCALVTGTVTRIRHEADGDDHVSVKLDAAYANLINARNRTAQAGALVAEIIPADQATVKAPRVGDRVELVGPYVLDRDHGWLEIHPAWGLRVIK
jgi:hypothetical protein